MDKKISFLLVCISFLLKIIIDIVNIANYITIKKAYEVMIFLSYPTISKFYALYVWNVQKTVRAKGE